MLKRRCPYRWQASSHRFFSVDAIWFTPQIPVGAGLPGIGPYQSKLLDKRTPRSSHATFWRVAIRQASLSVVTHQSLPDRPSSVLAVTLCANPLQASSHKCYRSAHRLRGRALAASDGTSKWRVPRSRIDASRGRFQELLNGRPISGTAIALS